VSQERFQDRHNSTVDLCICMGVFKVCHKKGGVNIHIYITYQLSFESTIQQAHICQVAELK
jgi:hypothetical protein